MLCRVKGNTWGAMYRATVMRPKEDEDESARRERLDSSSHSNNGPLHHAQPPTQPEYPYAPSKPAPSRPPFNNSYHPPTAAAPSPHVPTLPKSPPPQASSVAYPSADYHPTRDKPASNYYDPTSDSGSGRGSTWADAQAPASQV